MNFSTKVKNNLSIYKSNILKIEEKGIFKYHGRNHESSHILPAKDKNKNFLVEELRRQQIDKSTLIIDTYKITLHSYWYHLNSSQVMCLNAFFEIRNNGEALTKILEMMGINEKAISCEFEKIMSDRSSVDLLIHCEDQKNIFVEIKYTESNFGTVNKDKNPKYYDFWKKSYQDILSEGSFYKHYEAARNISFSKGGNYTVFLVPKSNTIINKKYDDFDKSIINRNTVNFRRCYWEDLMKSDLFSNDFKNKYYFSAILEPSEYQEKFKKP